MNRKEEFLKTLTFIFKADEAEKKDLSCVAVLIGVFDLRSKTPIIGVINQPFHKFDVTSQTFASINYWGVNLPRFKKVSPNLKNPVNPDPKTVEFQKISNF